MIFDAFTPLICEKKVANYALLQCKTLSLKIQKCKIFEEFHVCIVNSVIKILVKIVAKIIVMIVVKIVFTASSSAST